MKLLPSQEKIAEAQRSGQTLGRGMDFALVVLVAVGFGWVLDRWLGTQPVCMIVLFGLAVVAQFIKMYYEYKVTMEAHEAQRAEAASSRSRSSQSAAQSSSEPA